MIKRTIEISTRGMFLSVEMDQLVLALDGREIHRAPIEDIGVLVLATTGATYTHSVITRLLSTGAVIVACDDKHLPCGMLLPQDNCLQTQRLATQVAVKKPLLKQLWRQLVMAKIAHQAEMIPHDADCQLALKAMRNDVGSGDPRNVEAQAAKRYWHALFGPEFRRDPAGLPPNNLLNYGYMVLRASVARAVAGAGLHPSLGIHHHNRSDTFCLADDMMEPLRPLVDRRVKALHSTGALNVDKETKTQLLGVLTETVSLGEDTGPLMVALERMAASLVRCYAGESKQLEIPKTVELSGYRFMWLFVMFDLPVETKMDRKRYTQFRKMLLKDGFAMMQFSVYVRHCASEENADVHAKRVDGHVPPDGEVRVLRVTDKQYEHMEVFWGKKRKPPEKPAAQLELF